MKNLIESVCMKCKRHMQWKDQEHGYPVLPVYAQALIEQGASVVQSHGVCDDCAPAYLAECRGAK